MHHPASGTYFHPVHHCGSSDAIPVSCMHLCGCLRAYLRTHPQATTPYGVLKNMTPTIERVSTL